MPNERDLHIDAALTAISLKYQNGGYIAPLIAPKVNVAKISDKIKVYDSTHLKRIDTLRKNKAESQLLDWGMSTDDSYLCEGYAVHDIVSQDDIDNSDNPVKPAIDTTETLTDVIDLDYEYRVATLVCTAGSYASANKVTLSGTSQWSDYSSGVSDPISNIKTAKAAIRASSGKVPNVIAMDYKVALTLAHHPDIVDLRKYTNPELLTASGLPPVLFGLKVLEAGVIQDTAKKGQTMALSPVWGTYCLVGYSEPQPHLKSISLALTFDWKGREVTKDWDYKAKGWYIEVSQRGLDEKLIAASCGYLITGAIA